MWHHLSSYLERHKHSHCLQYQHEPRSEKKNGPQGFRPGLVQTGLGNHWKLLQTWNLWFRKKKDCSIYVVKIKALISFAVTGKLIGVFVFAFAKSLFSHDAAHIFHTNIFQWQLAVIVAMMISSDSTSFHQHVSTFHSFERLSIN